MAFKADFIAAFTANFTVQQRQEIYEGYIANFGLTKPDGTPLTTNSEKAQAVAEHFVSEIRRYRKAKIKAAAVAAIPEPADLTVT